MPRELEAHKLGAPIAEGTVPQGCGLASLYLSFESEEKT